MERIKMTREQFAEYLNYVRGCKFINVHAMTDADMYLRGNPYRGRVKKYTVTPMQFNYDYERAVNNRLEREGLDANFSADKLPWGAWVNGMRNKVITHKDMLYMRTYCVRNSKPKTFYIVDGHLASKEEMANIKVWLKPTSTSAKQESAGLVEEFQVKPRDYKFSSLMAVTINHTRIYLVD